MAISRTDAKLLLLRLCCIFSALGSLIMYCLSGTHTAQLIRVTSFWYSAMALFIQTTVCTLLLMVEMASLMITGSTTTVLNHLGLSLPLIIIDWILALFTTGTACAVLGAASSSAVGRRITSKLVRTLAYGALAWLAGALAGAAACCHMRIAKSRRPQRRAAGRGVQMTTYYM